jgi:hypothetical protein
MVGRQRDVVVQVRLNRQSRKQRSAASNDSHVQLTAHLHDFIEIAIVA